MYNQKNKPILTHTSDISEFYINKVYRMYEYIFHFHYEYDAEGHDRSESPWRLNREETEQMYS